MVKTSRNRGDSEGGGGGGGPIQMLRDTMSKC